MKTETEQIKARDPRIPILFVDDDPIAHRILRHHLKGWQLTCVFSGKEALKALEKENYVIVLTDLIMPEMDGIELLHELKRKYGNRVQVIVVTASDQLEYLTKALDGGANDYLLKPLKRDELEVVLEHALSKINRWNRAMKELVARKKGV